MSNYLSLKQYTYLLQSLETLFYIIDYLQIRLYTEFWWFTQVASVPHVKSKNKLLGENLF